MPRKTEWTERELKRLKLLYPSEKQFEEIVDDFPNRTANAVRLKASRLGLRRPTLPPFVFQTRTILLCSEGGGEFNGCLLRCASCNNWIQVEKYNLEETESSDLVICSKCGSNC